MHFKNLNTYTNSIADKELVQNSIVILLYIKIFKQKKKKKCFAKEI